MPPSFDAVYAPFVAALLAGGFGAPADGEWPAELVAAHIARNNDMIAAAAEQVAAGHEVSYDNESGVDDAELAAYADSAGGLPGLAREVERSALRLEQARNALGARADTPVQVIIRDHGQIVRDGPMTIGAFIEGNASFHLDLHLKQLKALELAPEAGPPDDFDEYQLVLLERSPSAPGLSEEDSATLQRRHLGHFAKMRRAGLMTVSGPIRGDDAIAGISIYRAGSPERARALAEDDPAVRAGRYNVRVLSWLTPKDAIQWRAH